MIKVDSISALHKILDCEKPKHPLITLINSSSIKFDKKYFDSDIIPEFYMITLKDNSDCELIYGRKNYDFHEGSLVFMHPGKVLKANGWYEPKQSDNGWSLCFHPDLIKSSELYNKISMYSFFQYESTEALHLSDQEKIIIQRIVRNIQDEYSANLDSYSNNLIISYIEMLLTYIERFYGRQFITRAHVYKEAVIKFKQLLNEQCSIEFIENSGMPTVKNLAREMGYSSNYLSDMLKKETGKTAQEHIKLHLLELAKNMLLSTNEPINYIATILGFEQASSFTKFIKAKLGVSPLDYRKQNIHRT